MFLCLKEALNVMNNKMQVQGDKMCSYFTAKNQGHLEFRPISICVFEVGFTFCFSLFVLRSPGQLLGSSPPLGLKLQKFLATYVSLLPEETKSMSLEIFNFCFNS